MNDPVFLSEPFIRTTNYEASPAANANAWGVCTPAQVVNELPGREKHYVPHYLPEQREHIDDFLKSTGVPAAGAAGGRLLVDAPPSQVQAGAAAPAASSQRTWQGRSIAGWDAIRSPGGLGVSLQTAPPRTGALKVVTTALRAGYLRKNGVPYSEDTVVTEYFDRLSAYETDWLTVLTIVEDPRS